MTTILKGENILVRRNLLQADGTTPLLVSSLTLAKATIIQFGTPLQTYTLNTNAELRQGTTTSQLELEIKKTLSATFAKGDIIIEWEIEINIAEFDVDTVNNQQFRETALYAAD